MPLNSRVFRGNLVLPNGVTADGELRVEAGRIVQLRPRPAQAADAPMTDAGAGFIVPGYVDIHVHGGAGADFMDGTPQAFDTVLRAHARHGTTSLLPTTTVARHDQIIRVLELVRQAKDGGARAGARVLGAHFYGPYFAADAKGCHPGAALRPPRPEEFEAYLAYADAIALATVAPELPGAEAFAAACAKRGVRLNVGHSNAAFDQVAAAVRWGARHVDHLYCAMSDKTKLRQRQPYPMMGGVLEATLYFDELTTEVIADGKHLSPDLLKLAYKLKGPDRLALVTDCSRALDMPEGEYLFGPSDGGEPFVHKDGVGMMPDGKGLASSTRGMDHMVRTFHAQTGAPLHEVIRMATLTPARICGWDMELGSLEVGKRADLLVLDRELRIQRVFRDGQEIGEPGASAASATGATATAHP
jgi:N-acetylglucosamine-6-phosphate deacetylase